jgi:hypothetical protein
MKFQYRYLAKEKLAKANELLASKKDDKLRYACLELRECIEALAYDLLVAYLKEVPLKALTVWQPDKVMKELLRIDPSADKSSHLRIKEEGRDGKPDGPWRSYGEDRRLGARTLTKAWQSLGHFLHVPTIKQSQQEHPFDAAKVRETAEAIRAELAYVLEAKIWNANFGRSAGSAACGSTEIWRGSRMWELWSKIRGGGKARWCLLIHSGEIQLGLQTVWHFSGNCGK